MPEQLTPQQISLYEENGYLVIENQIPKGWLAKIHAEISRFEEEAAELEHSNDRLDLEDSHTRAAPRLRRINEAEAKALPVKAGSLVILHPLIPHASLPNHTNGFRWSFDLRYNVTGQPTGRSHFPDFIAYSQSQPERVLQDWKEWRGLWETARRKLSKGEHIPIHRWQSDAPFCA